MIMRATRPPMIERKRALTEDRSLRDWKAQRLRSGRL